MAQQQSLFGDLPVALEPRDRLFFALFPDPATALQVLGRLLPACRCEPRIPLTRTGLNHGPVLRRANDIFGSTVNIAAGWEFESLVDSRRARPKSVILGIAAAWSF